MKESWSYDPVGGACFRDPGDGDSVTIERSTFLARYDPLTGVVAKLKNRLVERFGRRSPIISSDRVVARRIHCRIRRSVSEAQWRRKVPLHHVVAMLQKRRRNQIPKRRVLEHRKRLAPHWSHGADVVW